MRAGFAPTPVSVQVAPDGAPTGTGNVCAMFARGYVEVLFKTAETPLGREFEAALARHSGVQLAAFAVADAAPWHRRLGEAGFPQRPLRHSSGRSTPRPAPPTAAFTVARVEPGEMAEGRIQMLTHHTEDAVWQKRWLTHPNGARGLASLVIAVADVDEAAARFARFTDRPAMPTRSGQAVQLDRGRDRSCHARRFRGGAAGDRDPGAAVHRRLRRHGASLDAVEAILRAAACASRRAGDCLVAPFPEELGQGAWLFGESSQLSIDSRSEAYAASGIAGCDELKRAMARFADAKPLLTHLLRQISAARARPRPASRRCRRAASAPLAPGVGSISSPKSLERLGAQLGVVERVRERLAQLGGALGRHAGRAEERLVERERAEHQRHHLPGRLVLGEVQHQRRVDLRILVRARAAADS